MSRANVRVASLAPTTVPKARSGAVLSRSLINRTLAMAALLGAASSSSSCAAVALARSFFRKARTLRREADVRQCFRAPSLPGPNAERSGGKWTNGHYREASVRRSRDSQ